MTAELAFGESIWRGEALDHRAQLLAGGLSRLGVNDGDVIAAMLRNDPVYIDIIQVCRIAGCYYCPINWHFKADEAAYILKDSGAKVLFVHEDLLPNLGDSVPDSIIVLVVRPHLIQSDKPAPVRRSADKERIYYEEWLSEQTPYAGPTRTPRGHMAYTSGTSGRPKGIRRFPVPVERQATQQALAKEAIRVAYGIVPGVRALMSAPLYHSAPTVFAQHALLHGERFVLASRFDAEETLALIEHHRIHTAYLVPVMYVRLLRLPAEVRARYDLSSLRFVASTGSPCAPDIKQAMMDWWGAVIHETYASSETGLVTVIDALTSMRKPGSAGKPIGEAVVKILNSDGQPCKQGEVGTIYVKQPAYPDFTYNNNEAARREIERDGLITVGDMGYLDEEGYLYVCDRASDMVISGGVNIYPAEIEHVLINLPGISDCAVFGIPDEEYGEALAAAIVVEAGSDLTPETISGYLKQRIAGYKVPCRIHIVSSLPRDDSGKVAKRKLRDTFWSGRRI